jgi:UDP-N-acetylmuramoyl-L-alanyl-D-glutamate--2,6-diaminopimelate ligase
VKLADILKDVDVVGLSGPTDIEIEGIACDSRLVRERFLFVAIRGEKLDGGLFIPDAVKRGATAIMCDSRPLGLRASALKKYQELKRGDAKPQRSAPRENGVEAASSPAIAGQDAASTDVTWICVSGTRRALAQAAANFHANPSKSLGLVGITGTNGKTTVCHLIRRILEQAGYPCGMIGTIIYRVGDEVIPADRTTPDSLLLNSLLAKMITKGCRYAVMEVSSHSLEQQRVEKLDFDVAVFTNLTRDHLDYHGTLENYLRAKALLFESLSAQQKNGFPRCAVVCVDRPEGEYIAARTPVQVVTYGLSSNAAVTAENVRLHPRGCSFTACTPWGNFEVASCLIGRHNVLNMLAAAAVGLSQGVEISTIQQAVATASPVPGRLEFIRNDRGCSVVVDYAHTDDALKNVLTALREITKGKLIVVFGCGGDRDRGKRSKMGEVVNQLGDFAVVTSDNPRSEDPLEIIAEILRGFGGGKPSFRVESDRRKAIAAAISMAAKGDTVLIAGKGHETYQEFKGYRIHFDDREVVRELVA